ncbi:hypothetical protein [Azonexus sp.]|uniref:hypothetical protein n=1 Tax=Azonexus sp. TaxID=1872668 RepID=UPI0027BA69CD|nr:hypothetical protein [Azonexus sp.]
MTDAAKDPTSCPNWGKGGRYVIDPVTKQRVPAAAVPQVPAVQAPADEKSSVKKGK